jgi:formylmethanofuran dehydrogenase subunit E
MDQTELARGFHGHDCPGLAIGIRVAQAALQAVGPHSAQNEVVAIVESDM